ncbi:MAG: MFS transporter [Paracoccaceae bacterium]
MRAIVTVLALWAAGLGAAAQFGKMSVAYPVLTFVYSGASENGYPAQSVVEIGLILSVVGMVGLILGTTAGLWVTRLGPRRVVVLALVLGGALSLVQTTFPPYPLMMLSRVLEGLSHLAIVVVGPTAIAGQAGARWQGAAMTLWSSFFGVAYAVLFAFGPDLVLEQGAGVLFQWHALWMLGCAGILWLLLPRDVPITVVEGEGSLWRDHRMIYASPWIAAPAMGFFCYTFLYVAVLTLLPPEVPLAQRALAATGMPLISIAVSLTLGVLLLGRMPAVRLVQWGYLAAMPGFVLLALVWGQGPGMLVAGLWLSAALGIVQGASFAAIPQLNQTPGTRAQASGAIAQLGNLGTTTGTPVPAAVMFGAGPWGLALVALAACALGICLHAVQARRRQIRSI